MILPKFHLIRRYYWAKEDDDRIDNRINEPRYDEQSSHVVTDKYNLLMHVNVNFITFLLP